MEGLNTLGIAPLSILIYVLNTGLLLVVLIYVLYKPLLKFIDERRKQIADSVDEARLLKEELDKKSEEASSAQAHFEEELKKERENLRKFAEEKRAQLESDMNLARTEMMQKAEADIEAHKASMVKEVEADLLNLMKKIILEIVQHKVPENVIQDSIKDAWKQYK
ncbi:ATP synthase F0 subunit B [Candidatus Peregrinibacteria bacterium]|nr:MAG: ATP synthase F0 subunit B [Candidatus Peregrinibacteria bacterium]